MSPDGCFAVYLATGDDKAHFSGSDVRLIDFETNQNVSLFDSPSAEGPLRSVEEDGDSEIFAYGQPGRVWAGDSRSFVLQTFRGSKGALVHFDAVRKTRRVIRWPGVRSARLIDVYEDKALVAVSSPNESENLFELSLGALADSLSGKGGDLADSELRLVCEDMLSARFDFEAEIVRHFPADRGRLSETAIESLLLLPKTAEKSKPCPLVMLFHGVSIFHIFSAENKRQQQM